MPETAETLYSVTPCKHFPRKIANTIACLKPNVTKLMITDIKTNQTCSLMLVPIFYSVTIIRKKKNGETYGVDL